MPANSFPNNGMDTPAATWVFRSDWKASSRSFVSTRSMNQF